MTFDIVTIFPRMIHAALTEGVVGRAVARGVLNVRAHDLRDFTDDRHRTVDDVPYGGGPGMVMKPEPVVRAVERIRADGRPDDVILLSPQGTIFTQAEAWRLSRMQRVVLICGRYEGIDERVRELVGAREMSVGDFVVSGGELPALIVVDAVGRLVPGVVGDGQSVEQDSFARGLLDCPHYTRPPSYGGLQVPDVLLSGHHAQVQRWRKTEALRRTLQMRPDLLDGAELDDEGRAILEALVKETGHERH